MYRVSCISIHKINYTTIGLKIHDDTRKFKGYTNTHNKHYTRRRNWKYNTPFLGEQIL